MANALVYRADTLVFIIFVKCIAVRVNTVVFGETLVVCWANTVIFGKKFCGILGKFSDTLGK